MRILVVEDDDTLREQLVDTLLTNGYVVDSAGDGEEAHFMGDTEPYDAVVLDLGLPMIDGASILRKWRSAERIFPVLILTARDTWSEKVEGLDAGADDYLTKPFNMEELLARLRALIRRLTGNANPLLECGDVVLDTRNSRVSEAGMPIKLTAQEFKLLDFMMHHKGEVVSRTTLTEHIYDQDFDRDSNTIEVFINRIRKKLKSNVIHTVRGLGYRLEEEV